MKRNTTPIVVLCAAILTTAATRSSATPNHNKNTLMVSVTIESIYNHQFQVVIPVTINKHFNIGSDNGDVRNRISGIVYKPIGGKYLANLYINEKTKQGINIGGSQNFTLELNKPVGLGIVSSIASTRVIKLTQSSH